MAFDYPVVLDLLDVAVLVVGGGAVASRKVAALADAGARVTVVAPLIGDAAAERATIVRRRRFRPRDCRGARLVVAATDDPTVNAAVALAARRHGVWVNSADDPANCDLVLPAVARSGPVTVAVSTGGASPALAAHLRDRIAADLLGPRVAAAAEQLRSERAAVRRAGASTEAVDWAPRLAALVDPPVR